MMRSFSPRRATPRAWQSCNGTKSREPTSRISVSFQQRPSVQNRLVRDERGLDFNRRNVDAAHLQHVVGPAAVDVVAPFVHAVLIAASRPRTEEGVLGALALVPIHDGRGRPLDLELTEFTGLG